MNYAERVLLGCKGKTVAEVSMLGTEKDGLEGVRLTFTDGTMVQFVYDLDEADFLIQEAIGD